MKYKSIVLNLMLGILSCSLVVGAQTFHTHESDSPIHNDKIAFTSITSEDLNNNQTLLMSTLIYYAITHISDGRWVEASDIDRGWQIQKINVEDKVHYLVWPDKRIQDENKHIEPNWFAIDGDTVTYHSFVIHSQGYESTHAVAMQEIINTVNNKRSINMINSMLANLVIV